MAASGFVNIESLVSRERPSITGIDVMKMYFLSVQASQPRSPLQSPLYRGSLHLDVESYISMLVYRSL